MHPAIAQHFPEPRVVSFSEFFAPFFAALERRSAPPQSDRDRRLAIMNRTQEALKRKRAPIQALFDAAKNGDCNGIRNAIASGVPVNSRDPYHGYTAIHWAVHYKQLDAYHLLCSFPGVDRNLPNADGYTPFALACKLHSDVVFPVYIYAPEYDKTALSSQYPFHCSGTPEHVARYVAETQSYSGHDGGRRQATESMSSAGFLGAGSRTPDPAVVAGIRAEIAAEKAQVKLECVRLDMGISINGGSRGRSDNGSWCRPAGSNSGFTHFDSYSSWADRYCSHDENKSSAFCSGSGGYSYGGGKW